VGHLGDPRWNGLSGLAASRYNPGVWWIHNDGGSGTKEAGRFYAVTTEGTLLAEYVLVGVSTLAAQGQGPVDIEDVAVGPGPGGGPYLYLGDIGGNRYTPFGRPSVRIFRIPEPKVEAPTGAPVPMQITDYTTLHFTYSDALRYDAETLMVDSNGDLYIVTKDMGAGTSIVYRRAVTDDPSNPVLTPVATLHFGSTQLPGSPGATAGDISVYGTAAVIRTHDHIFMWVKPPDTPWASTFASITPYILPAAPPHYYEAVAFDWSGVNVYDTYESKDAAAALQMYKRRTLVSAYTKYLPCISRALWNKEARYLIE
jgi:hypothetical protein